MKPNRRFPKSSYHYKYRADKKARMTYILWSRCRDGVVMIADRKFTVDYGSSYLHDNKLVHEVAGIVVGFSGSRGVFELFQTQIRKHVMESEGGIAHDEYILKTSELVERLNNRFARQEGFDALIAIDNEPSSLKYFYPDGRMESVKTCKAIGTGAPHGSIFLNQLWGSSMSMEQVAELGYFIIKYIEAFELDLSVGVAEGAHPQIWFLPDGFAPDGSCKVFEPNQALLDKLETNTTIRLQRYRNSLPDLYDL